MDDTDARPTESPPAPTPRPAAGPTAHPGPTRRPPAWVPVAAGVVAVVVAVVAGRARPAGERGRRGYGWLAALRRAAMDERTRTALKRAVTGVDRSAVLRLLGPPGAVDGGGGAVRAPARTEYLSADVWFYPLDDDRRHAMAVRFDGPRVGAAEFPRPARVGRGGKSDRRSETRALGRVTHAASALLVAASRSRPLVWPAASSTSARPAIIAALSVQ